MSDVIQKLKKKYEEDIDEISELRNDALLMRTDSNAKVLAILLKKFIDTADELMISKQEDDRMDKMHQSLKEILSGIKDAFKNIRIPEIKPQINFDTEAIRELARAIKEQNSNILKLMSSKNDDINKKEMISLISRQNQLISKAFQQMDYSEQLNKIAEALNQEKNIEKKEEKQEREVKEFVIERNLIGRIEKVIPIYE